LVATEKEKDWNQEGGQKAATALKVEARTSLLADAFRGATRKRGLSGSDLLSGGATAAYNGNLLTRHHMRWWKRNVSNLFMAWVCWMDGFSRQINI
jgi:hypothetical protein